MTDKIEKRRFGMHANLLYDVITKQAGTLQKAILEGVMNGVDAGASRIDVSLDRRTLTIVDDGRGFVGRREIEEFFETFGTPHKEGDATYGRFRMGRGQLMAFGANTWRTNQFRMDVNIRENGLDYDLSGDDDAPQADRVKGCSIEVRLYKELLPSERDEVEREIRKWVAWVSVPVTLNGQVISADPAGAKWTVETEDAYFKLATTKTTLSIYNLGVLVMDASASRFGIGGVVVSKRRLDVNFARNDVQSECAVFRKIKAELRKHSDQESSSKRKLTDGQKTHLARRIATGDMSWNEAWKAPVFTDVDGKSFDLTRLYNKFYSTRKLLAAPKGDRTAIKVLQQGMAIALAQETLDRFDAADVPALVEALRTFARANLRNATRHWQAENLLKTLDAIEPQTVDDYRHLIDSTFETVDKKELNANRRMLLTVAHKGSSVVAGALGRQIRRTIPGRSQVAQAWTDGTSSIWIETGSLAMLSAGYQGCTRFAALLLHEYMHEAPDTETHEHDTEFYENFHDAAIDSDVLGKAATAMMKQMAEIARREGRKPNVSVSLFEDMEATLVSIGGAGTPTEDTAAVDAETDPFAGDLLSRAA